MVEEWRNAAYLLELFASGPCWTVFSKFATNGSFIYLAHVTAITCKANVQSDNTTHTRIEIVHTNNKCDYNRVSNLTAMTRPVWSISPLYPVFILSRFHLEWEIMGSNPAVGKIEVINFEKQFMDIKYWIDFDQYCSALFLGLFVPLSFLFDFPNT